MQVLHAEANILSLRALSTNKSNGSLVVGYLQSAFRCITAGLASIWPRGQRPEHIIADRYAGCRWTDCIERQMIDDTINYPIKRF
jgi:hypothetical protein